MQTETTKTATPAPFDLTSPCAAPGCLGLAVGDLLLCPVCWAASPTRLRARWIVTRAGWRDAIKVRTDVLEWTYLLRDARLALVASLAPATDAPVEAAA